MAAKTEALRSVSLSLWLSCASKCFACVQCRAKRYTKECEEEDRAKCHACVGRFVAHEGGRRQAVDSKREKEGGLKGHAKK